MKYANNFHVEIMRLVVKATRRGDIAEVERLTRIADRLHRMTFRYDASIDRTNKALEIQERHLRIAALKRGAPR